MPGEADDLAPLIEQTGGALRFQPFEIGIRQRPAFRRDQTGEMLTRYLVLIVAEKSLAGAVQAQDLPLQIEHGNAVHRGIQNGA